MGSKGISGTSDDRGLGAVTPKLGERLQQIPVITPETSVQKTTIPGTAKILGNPQAPWHLVEG